MPTLKVNTPFAFYHDGVTRTEYPEGVQDIPDDAAKVALKEKWAETTDEDSGKGKGKGKGKEG